MKKYTTPVVELKEYRLSTAIANCSFQKVECDGVPPWQENKKGPGGGGGDES